MHRSGGKRGPVVPRVRSEADETFRAYEADASHERVWYLKPVFHCDVHLERGWVDSLGITHRAILHGDKWLVLCDTPLFTTTLRHRGNGNIRVSTDPPNCLQCALIR